MGMMGVKNFAAVVNPPHATILAVGAGEERVVVKKGDRKLYLISGKSVVKSYEIDLGRQPVGHGIGHHLEQVGNVKLRFQIILFPTR